MPPVEPLLPTAVIHALPRSVLCNPPRNYQSGLAGTASPEHRGKLERNSSCNWISSVFGWSQPSYHREPSSAIYFISFGTVCCLTQS